MSNAADFAIKDGVLTNYTGPGGDVEIPEGVTGIKNDYWHPVFRGKNVKRVRIPRSMTTIGMSAFYECKELEEVILHEGVTAIGTDAFLGCKNLKQITLPESLTTLEQEAFRASGLESIVIPGGITVLPRNLFYFCANLKHVTLPEGLTEIGASAFDTCVALAELRIPDSVKTIGESAFMRCENLEKIDLPAGDVQFGDWVFTRCKKMADSQGMVIVRNIVFDYFGEDTTITVPDGVRRIGRGAFAKTELSRIQIPASVREIDTWALSSDKLEYVSPLHPECVLDKDAFGLRMPTKFLQNLGNILPNMGDGMVRNYIMRYWYWQNLAQPLRIEIFATRQSTGMVNAYRKWTTEEEFQTLVPSAAEPVFSRLAGKPSVKDCNFAAAFLCNYHTYLPDETVQRFHDKLKTLKTGAKAVKTMEENVALAERLGKQTTVEENLPAAERIVQEELLKKKQSMKDLEKQVKDRFSLTYKDLPELWYPDGSKAAPCILGWLLIAHEEMNENPWKQRKGVPGLCEAAKEVLAELDPARVQQVMLALADANLGITGKSKKMYLAYPICRYADEALMAELCTRAPKWRSQVSGNSAPPLYEFRMACLYSHTRSAMMFADRFGDLDLYAKIRGTDADTVRDRFLSDVGLDETGGKTYDLGNQTVTARLQEDFTFLVELPTGKTAKSLPKKGADPDKYAAANADFSEMKKSAKKIVKNRVTILFADFLEGRSRKADSWKESYQGNPLLRQVGSSLVWVQAGKTFVITASGATGMDGSVYTIGDGHIALAHPMDMTREELESWQKYFTSKGIKQPFEQIWEPVMDPATVKEDRYAGCMIPYYRFVGQKKHGIHVEDEDFHNEINISFDDCDAYVERIDWLRHMIEMDNRFEVQEITFPKFTRKVNHIIAYLDRVTIFERIKKDDTTVAALLNAFTLAQITEFIKVALESNATNVTAILLEYKNQNFADFDPMEEFSLDL